MKNLFKAILLGVLIGNTAIAGVAPTNSNSQDGTSLKTHSNITVPNSQMTDLGGLDALIETGNKNVLKNASFEHKVFDTNWTLLGAATDAVETTTVIDGKKAAKINITASGDGITESLVPIVNTLNQQMEASCKVNTSMTNIQLCATAGGVEQSCQPVPATGSYQAVSANFQGPVNGTAVGVKIKSTSAGTGAVYADDCFVGPARNLSQVSQAQLLGGITISGCSTQPNNASSTYASLVGAGCTYTPFGQVQATGTQNVSLKIPSVGAGDLKIELEGYIGDNNASQVAMFQWTDGTNVAREQSTTVGYAGLGSNSIIQSIPYSSAQSNLTLELKGKYSGTSSTPGINTSFGPTVVRVYYYPSAASATTALTSANNVASWSGYHDGSCTWDTTATGTSFATYSGSTNSSCSLNQVTNRNFGTVSPYGGTGASALPGITFTPPRAGRYYVCGNIAAWNGTANVHSSYRLWDGTTEIARTFTRQSGSVTDMNVLPACGIYNAASTSSVNLYFQGVGSSAGDTFISTNGQSTAHTIEWSIFAIDGMGGPVILPATASSGATNYLTGGDGESGANVCTPYADAAGVAPVTGSGGSPTVTCALSSVSPISGTQSYVLTKPASNVQGQGWSFPFTVDASAQAKMLQVSFDYQVDSNYTVGSDTSTPDIVAYVYGPTDGTPQLTQLTPYKALGGSGTLKFQGNLQTAASGKAYRLILHEPNTGTLASSIKVDNIVVSPVLRQFGTPVTDSAPFLGSFSAGFGTVTNGLQSERIGDHLHVHGNFTDGTETSATAYIQLPSGMTIDPVKQAANNYLGFITRITSASTTINQQQGVVFYDGSTNNQVFLTLSMASSAFTKLGTTSFSGANATTFTVDFNVYIQGWSSSTQMSDQSGDNRIVVFTATKSANQSVTANVTDITFTATKDTHAAWNGSQYIVPVPGDYKVESLGVSVTNTNSIFDAYVNGTRKAAVYQTIGGAYTSGALTIENLKAGDALSFRWSGTDTVQGTNARLSISRISGNQQIQASETVSAKYYATAGGTSNATTPFNYDGKIYDSHNAVTTGSSWKFTAPSPGKYSVKAFFMYTSAPGGSVFAMIYKNGASLEQFGHFPTGSPAGSASTTVYLNAGEYIEVRANSSSYAWQGGAYPVTAGSTGPITIEIERVAN